jgi:hypothetical protein
MRMSRRRFLRPTYVCPRRTRASCGEDTHTYIYYTTMYLVFLIRLDIYRRRFLLRCICTRCGCRSRSSCPNSNGYWPAL